MKLRFFAFAALLSMGTAAFAQGSPDATTPSASDSAFQIRYASNLAIGDSVINMTNDGASSTGSGLADAANNFQQYGQLCANIYAYSPDEQLVSCCSCNVTPNGLNSLSVKNDLASNTLTPIIPSALVIKLVVTEGGSKCTASTAATIDQTSATRKAGLLAWGTTIHAAPTTAGTPAGTYAVTETQFANGQPNTEEFKRMAGLCAFIRGNGSGYGICKSCKIGGLGAGAR